MRTDLVLDAVRMALAQRGPGADVDLVHHSDAGACESSLRFVRLFDDRAPGGKTFSRLTGGRVVVPCVGCVLQASAVASDPGGDLAVVSPLGWPARIKQSMNHFRPGDLYQVRDSALESAPQRLARSGRRGISVIWRGKFGYLPRVAEHVGLVIAPVIDGRQGSMSTATDNPGTVGVVDQAKSELSDVASTVQGGGSLTAAIALAEHGAPTSEQVAAKRLRQRCGASERSSATQPRWHERRTSAQPSSSSIEKAERSQTFGSRLSEGFLLGRKHSNQKRQRC